MSTWVDNQQRPRSTLEIEADTIGHDLAHGWSHFLRGTRPPENSAADDSGEMARQDTETADSDNGDDANAAVPEAAVAHESTPGEQVQPQGQAETDGETDGDSEPAGSLVEDGNALEREAVPF